MTDAGIKGLCVSIDDTGMKDDRLGQCKFITTLNIRHTHVSESGIQIAFENLPGLKNLLSNFPIQVLADLSVRFPQYSLTSFECCPYDSYCPNFSLYKIGSLELSASMCSSVTKVTIQVQIGITDVEVLGLLHLKNLRELSINGVFRHTEITFEGGLAPLLVAFGKSLTLLKLECVDMEIDVGVIIENCPEISTLHLSDCSHVEQSEFLRSQKILSKLKFLTISCNPDRPESNNFHSYYLTSLLSSPELCKINIEWVDHFTDQVLLDAGNRNQFYKLEKVQLTYCDNITKRGIDVFFTDQNTLKELEFDDCKLVTNYDGKVWGMLIMEKNWELKLFVNLSP